MGLSVDSAFGALASAFSLHETSPLDTDHAWVELKAAQQNMVAADAGGNFRQIDEALTRTIEGDLNGDGVFNDHAFQTGNDNSFQLHAGKGRMF
jgi:hypothetical protein